MPISGKQAAKILNRHGFIFSRQRGSHAVFIKQTGNSKQVAVVPMHKELKRGTLRSIAKQSGLEAKEFGV